MSKRSQLLENSPDYVKILLFFPLKNKRLEQKQENVFEKMPFLILLQLQKIIAINLRTMNLGLFSKNKLSLHKLQNL